MNENSQNRQLEITFQAGGALRPGIIVAGKFALLKELGRGGFAVVYKAEDTLLRRYAALKLLTIVQHEEVVRRFIREGEAMANVRHPNVVAVYEMGQRRDGTYYIAQEFLYGHDLRRLLNERGRLDANEALDLMLPIMGGLITVHDQGIVHRDLKPDNIILSQTSAGEIIPKIIDFGIARMPVREGAPKTPASGGLGTPAYAAPEQLSEGSMVSDRVDVFAMGVVLYELLTGQRPFGSNEREKSDYAWYKVQSGVRPPAVSSRAPNVPPAVEGLIAQALSLEPYRRPSMRRLRDELLQARSQLFHAAGNALWSNTLMGGLKAPDVRAKVDPDEEAAPQSVTDVEVIWPPPAGKGQAPPPQDNWASPAPDTAWLFETPLSPDVPPKLRDKLFRAANRLSINALAEVVADTQGALKTASKYPNVLGSLLLLQAIALYWQGALDSAEQSARAAQGYFEGDSVSWTQQIVENSQPMPRNISAWYEATGQLALILGLEGKGNELPELADRLKLIELHRPINARHMIAVYRVAVSLARTGAAERAQSLLESAERQADRSLWQDSLVRAWNTGVWAFLMSAMGNRERSLTLHHNAVRFFQEVRDIRNECVQKVNLGNAYMQLGQAEAAESEFQDALERAEPMELLVVAPLKVNLILALSRLGKTKEAIELGGDALEQCKRNGDRRFECVAHLYLSMAHTAQAERCGGTMAEQALQNAAFHAQEAIRLGQDMPVMKAYAQAQFARVRISQRKPEFALQLAEEAIGLLSRVAQLEEAEPVIRLAYGKALYANGEKEKSREQFQLAYDKIKIQSDQLRTNWRDAFLKQIPEHLELEGILRTWFKSN